MSNVHPFHNSELEIKSYRRIQFLARNSIPKGLRFDFFQKNYLAPGCKNKNHELKYIFKRQGKLVYLIIIIINFLLTIFFRHSAYIWLYITKVKKNIDKCTIEDSLSVDTSKQTETFCILFIQFHFFLESFNTYFSLFAVLIERKRRRRQRLTFF